ncbi:hypothetical protein [Pseudomonas putida]|uniref:hypothetical protein n=1 Tax=Pseudomonas putida TaxID=303 RepID=UPI0008594926|nr:hypothetical protein [Pseudomonas putida]
MRPLNKFLMFNLVSVLVVVVATFVASFLYRINVGSEFSSSPNDWAAFGSYIGGIMGPLVSFFALIAVLLTIHLQRELLKTQRDEIKRMHELHMKAAEDQKLERFVLEFYALSERIDKYADNHIRKGDELEGILRYYRGFLADRNGSRKELLKMCRIFAKNYAGARYETYALFLRRIFRTIDKSKFLSDIQKRHYVGLLLDSLSPEERIFFLTWAMLFFTTVRKDLKKYLPAKEVDGESLLIPGVADYFASPPTSKTSAAPIT